ncbi:MAG TPA: PBP1A family penicillin-binding protein [Candidatus Acidoferrales bacterium]|nr:PBP1A family penicillin-binding protein [Candidatus Acidoferrales bacterium]
MLSLPPITLRLRGRELIGRMAFAVLLLCAIALGVATGLLFVYASDLPEIHALEDYRPNVVTELYADDGQPIGSFALQRRILITYEQVPRVLKDAVLVTEDQHFEEHWGVDFPRVAQAAWRNIIQRRKAEGASTLTMQLARVLFLSPDKRFQRKVQETLLAIQIERRYTKQQIFAMYANQIYLAHGNYGFEAASEFYFGHPAGQLKLTEAALLAGMIRGPSYSPILHPQRALQRRNWVLDRMAREGKITPREALEAVKLPLGLHLQYPRNDLAPYFFEEIRKSLESAYGTEAVHERGLRVYTTLNVPMQRAANQAISDGLHAYDRRHGWRGDLPNILRTNPAAGLETYEDDDWKRPIEKDSYVTGLVTAVDDKTAKVRIGPYRAVLTAPDIAWTGRKSPAQLLKPGDLAEFYIKDLSNMVARVGLEQKPQAQGAMVAIDNPTGEIRAMVGGYSFEESKFNRATQAVRQVGSSFKPYVYATAIEKGMSPFDTVVDAPLTTTSGGQAYSPHNYDEKYEGTITLRRALAGSRNVPAVKVAEKIGINSVVEMARRFGITTPMPPYLPVALGAADLRLIEHASAFTVFPDDGIRIEPHMIRRVTSYDGALLEEARPEVHDVISPQVARTMVAMLEEVVQMGTAIKAKELGRPLAGKTGTTNDFTDAWFVGFSPSLTAGVWVGFDDKQTSLGKKETGAKAALPIWMEFMKAALGDKPPEDFPNVEPLSKLAQTKQVQVDTPDTAPTEEVPEGPTKKVPPAKPPVTTPLPGKSTGNGAPASPSPR